VIVDTSVWVEFLRGTGSPGQRALEERIRSGASIVVPDVVLAEVLVGTTDEAVAARWERALSQFDLEPTRPIEDARSAAAVHRACRRQGETVRSLVDCFVAAFALRLALPVLHRDRDFEVMASAVGIQTRSTLEGDVA
jgi:predicted nucleic acid-binding protein